jgi:hypothetical protein
MTANATRHFRAIVLSVVGGSMLAVLLTSPGASVADSLPGDQPHFACLVTGTHSCATAATNCLHSGCIECNSGCPGNIFAVATCISAAEGSTRCLAVYTSCEILSSRSQPCNILCFCNLVEYYDSPCNGTWQSGCLGDTPVPVP